MSPKLGFAVVFSIALALTARPVDADPWNGADKWGVGFHLTGMGLSPADTETDTEDELGLGGAGLQVRYRLNRRWELEAELDQVKGELEDGGLSRDYKSMTLAGMFHINPQSQWTWSVVAGLGGGSDDVRFAQMTDGKPTSSSATFSHAHLHLGVALERRFKHIGVAAQLRAIAMARNEDEADGPAFAGSDEPTPREESGARFNLVVTYYF